MAASPWAGAHGCRGGKKQKHIFVMLLFVLAHDLTHGVCVGKMLWVGQGGWGQLLGWLQQPYLGSCGAHRDPVVVIWMHRAWPPAKAWLWQARVWFPGLAQALVLLHTPPCFFLPLFFFVYTRISWFKLEARLMAAGAACAVCSTTDWVCGSANFKCTLVRVCRTSSLFFLQDVDCPWNFH